MNATATGDNSSKWKILEKIMVYMFSKRATEFGNILADVFNEYGNHVPQVYHPSYTLSGSIGEGMPIYNDIDFMMIQKDMLITDIDNSLAYMISKPIKPAEINSNKIHFKMDSGECHHGFTRLELISKITKKNNLNRYCKKLNGKFYLNAHKYIQGYNKTMLNHLCLQLTPQVTGPALTFAGFDHVFAITGSNDLGFSTTFLNRIPLAKYQPNLSSDRLENIRICVVAKAHENSTHPCLEFRLSFSLLENFLVKAFTLKQKCYYYLLKLIYRIMSQDGKKKGRGFSSYLLKKLMFRTIGEEKTSFWEQPMIKVLPCLLFKKLKTYIEIRCPNYFVTQNKMILNYSDEELHIMIKKIDWLQTNLWERIVFSTNHGSNILRYFVKDLQNMAPGENHFETVILQMFFKIESMTFRNHLGFFVTSMINTLPKCDKPILAILEVLNVTHDLNYPYEVKFNFRVVQQRQLCLFLFDAVEKSKDNKDFKQASVLNGFLYCIIILSITLVGTVDDKDIGGNVLLGLFHYINKDFTNAKSIFEKVADKKRWAFVPLFAAMPLPFLRGLCNTPRYFHNDKIISQLFLEKDLIYLESVSLALYLLIRISNKEAQKKRYEEQFRKYEHWIEDIDRVRYKFFDIYKRMLKNLCAGNV